MPWFSWDPSHLLIQDLERAQDRIIPEAGARPEAGSPPQSKEEEGAQAVSSSSPCNLVFFP